MRTNYVLIDYENVQVKSLSILKGEHFRIRVFLGPNNTKLPVELVLALQQLGDKAEYIVLDTSGKNALDFHIAYYLGILAAADPNGFFHIVSKDTGFDSLLQHLKNKKIHCARSASLEELPCFAAHTVKEKVTELKPNGNCEKPVAALVKIAVDDLIRRKASKPRTPKTLWSTIQAKCGKELASSEIDAVYEALIKMGYIKIDGAKISYLLPTTLP